MTERGSPCAPAPQRRIVHSALYVHLQDADRVAEDLREAGLEVGGPRDEDYGKREGSVTDPDGNMIRFGSPIR